ncbi:MAG: hypothetical protein PHW53_04470 [Patescibacteria group bacterium]|nr:hypothetical protein [Patescibacteria group bacterium]
MDTKTTTKTTTSNKKTITVIIIVLAVLVVAGGLYYGYNRWRQQRMANQILQEIYGVNTGMGGLLGKITGGGDLSEQIAQEIAKEEAESEAEQAAEEAREAAKTPKDRYNEAEEAEIYDDNSRSAAEEAKKDLEKVFGDVKLTAVSSSVYDSEGAVFSIMEFKISRLATGADLSALNEVIKDKGLEIIQSSIDDKTAMIMAGDMETYSYSVGFEVDGQDVSVNITKIAQ